MQLENQVVEVNDVGEKTLLVRITAQDAKVFRDAIKNWDKYDKNDAKQIEHMRHLIVTTKLAHNILWPSGVDELPTV